MLARRLGRSIPPPHPPVDAGAVDVQRAACVVQLNVILADTSFRVAAADNLTHVKRRFASAEPAGLNVHACKPQIANSQHDSLPPANV